MYKVKMFSGRYLFDDIENDINLFIEEKVLTDWEMVGNVNAVNYHDEFSGELEILYVATIRYWEGNNR